MRHSCGITSYASEQGTQCLIAFDRAWWLDDLLPPVQIVAHDGSQRDQALEHGDRGVCAHFEPARFEGDVSREVRQHGIAEVGGQGDTQRLWPGRWLSLQQPLLHGGFDGLRLNHLVQELEQGGAIKEVGAADSLDVTDGFHEGLGGGAADTEELLDVLARPGLGAGAVGFLADGVEIARPLDRPCHRILPPNHAGLSVGDYWPTCQLLLASEWFFTHDNANCRGLWRATLKVSASPLILQEPLHNCQKHPKCLMSKLTALHILPEGLPPEDLFRDLRRLIVEAQRHAAAAVNMSLTALYWRVGQRISKELLRGDRAAYGEVLIGQVAERLTDDYGRGFTRKNLWRMVQFAEAFPDENIVATLWRQLSWSHFRELLPLRQPFQREFYAEMCRVEGWSVRTLHERIESMLYERTALAKQPDKVIEHELAALRSTGEVSQSLILKDPYILDFLGLEDRYLERDLEDAILRELELFLLELGAGFSFVARQKRIQLDGADFYIDLLFYNRKLKRLVAVDLKQSSFKPEYKGQMELYLRWLARYESEEGEASPLGIILCTDKSSEQIELLELDSAGIHVAEYLTIFPPALVLERKLHEAITNARARFEQKELQDDNR